MTIQFFESAFRYQQPFSRILFSEHTREQIILYSTAYFPLTEQYCILEEQQTRILKCQEESKVVQLSLPFIEEQRQLDADRRHWEKRLQAIALELISEPARIEAAYKVKAVRVEPVGVIYLWPISG